MTLFGDVPAETISDLENQRYRFDSFLSASLALFQMCTENNWNSIMYPNIRQTSIFYSLYFVAFFVLLVTLALNIVVGIIIDGFQLTQQRREESERVEKELAAAESSGGPDGGGSGGAATGSPAGKLGLKKWWARDILDDHGGVNAARGYELSTEELATLAQDASVIEDQLYQVRRRGHGSISSSGGARGGRGVGLRSRVLRCVASAGRRRSRVRARAFPFSPFFPSRAHAHTHNTHTLHFPRRSRSATKPTLLALSTRQ